MYCDRHLMHLQENHHVAWAGPLAGFKPGYYDFGFQKILVTSGPRLIVPAPGDFATLQKLFTELFRDNLKRVYAWLKASLRTLYAGHPFRPAPMLAIAGPKACGKSLFQNLVTEMFGGRSAKPYRYLTGQTPFNGDLLAAEHLLIEDDANQTDLRFRRQFGSQLKNLVFNETQSLHRKTRDAVSVSGFSRVTITLNEEAENLAVLPPIDDSLLDKITLIRAYPASYPYGKDDLAGRTAYRKQLSAELPAFLHFLRGLRIPESLQDQRSGVRAYQDPELMQELLMMSPELALLELIDTVWIWGVDRLPWTGTAGELRGILMEKDRSGRASRLLEWSNACGTYLARLQKTFPERFSGQKTGAWMRKWTILPRTEEYL